MRRLLIAVLAVLCVAGVASATAASAAPTRPHHTLVVHRHFAMGGSYRVRIVVTTHSLRPNHIRIRIGSTTQYAMTKRHHRRITIWLRLSVRTHTVTIQAVGTHARPTLTINFHPVSLLAIPQPASTHRPRPHAVTTPHKHRHSGTGSPLSPSQAVTVVNRRISAPGLYRVKVRIFARRHDRVRIRIGSQTRYATVAAHRRASIALTVRLRSRRHVTVHATGSKAPPSVTVTVQPVAPAADGGAPTSSNPPAGATGPTGPTGVTTEPRPAERSRHSAPPATGRSHSTTSSTRRTSTRACGASAGSGRASPAPSTGSRTPAMTRRTSASRTANSISHSSRRQRAAGAPNPTRARSSRPPTTSRSRTASSRSGRGSPAAARRSMTGRRSGPTGSPGRRTARSTCSRASEAPPATTGTARPRESATAPAPRAASAAAGTRSGSTGSPESSPTTTTAATSGRWRTSPA